MEITPDTIRSGTGASEENTAKYADALIVGSAVHKGAYPGLFKHLFDLFELNALSRKPVLLTATGASPAHGAVIDYHLRPLFLALAAAIALNHRLGRPSRTIIDYIA